MITASPTFQYWDIILKYETLVLIFIRAHGIRDFDLFVVALEALVSWFFVLDHTYARWIPIHIRDMKALQQNIKEEVIHKCGFFKRLNTRPLACLLTMVMNKTTLVKGLVAW